MDSTCVLDAHQHGFLDGLSLVRSCLIEIRKSRKFRKESGPKVTKIGSTSACYIKDRYNCNAMC